MLVNEFICFFCFSNLLNSVSVISVLLLISSSEPHHEACASCVSYHDIPDLPMASPVMPLVSPQLILPIQTYPSRILTPQQMYPMLPKAMFMPRPGPGPDQPLQISSSPVMNLDFLNQIPLQNGPALPGLVRSDINGKFYCSTDQRMRWF